MKFTNKRILPVFKGVYYTFWFLVLSFLGYNYLIDNASILEQYELGILVLVLFLMFIYWYKRAKHIEYDSSGLGLVFISKGVLLSEIRNYREQRIEFPKNRLKRFRVENLFFTKKLYLYLYTHGVVKKVCVDISFLGVKKTKALKMSLNKIVQENSSNK